MDAKSNPPATDEDLSLSQQMGRKAFYLEPFLILGASMLWMTVLPLAALVWSGGALAKRVHA